MTDVERIYVELNENKIDVFNINTKYISAASFCDEDGDRSIAVNEKHLGALEELKAALLHEQGHCETYSFYNEYTPKSLIGRLERRADRYVAENKITAQMIDFAHIREGFVDAWEFAEHFGVTVNYMKRLLNIHFGMEFMD
jgi:hypothetical protein